MSALGFVRIEASSGTVTQSQIFTYFNGGIIHVMSPIGMVRMFQCTFMSLSWSDNCEVAFEYPVCCQSLLLCVGSMLYMCVSYVYLAVVFSVESSPVANRRVIPPRPEQHGYRRSPRQEPARPNLTSRSLKIARATGSCRRQ